MSVYLWYLQELTRPYIGLPVVRALVPGLRPVGGGDLAAGRLYDVPVQCGWLTQPIQETDLNPTSHVLLEGVTP